ncbi:MAG TPA: hypothetical protein VK714_10185, partial [Myxococcota bacterium]|nr:hypothetical protein [Myxococcota bacterium]
RGVRIALDAARVDALKYTAPLESECGAGRPAKAPARRRAGHVVGRARTPESKPGKAVGTAMQNRPPTG